MLSTVWDEIIYHSQTSTALKENVTMFIVVKMCQWDRNRIYILIASRWSTLNKHWRACVIMVVAEALVPNRHQAINNIHADSVVTVVSNEPNHCIWRNLHIALKQSLRPSAAIWRHRSGSTLAQVMACRLTVPSHYLKQCWFPGSFEIHWLRQYF